ncbi:hypothetical protein BIWAKO_05986 [Bosea sp. BIWAKO-01]|nr:hypothetical protein BIWAKO_05986 [Bosea sp. BIWAKO-01]
MARRQAEPSDFPGRLATSPAIDASRPCAITARYGARTSDVVAMQLEYPGR